MAKYKAKIPFVLVSARLKTALGQGHPWVYREAVERAPEGLASGTWVRVKCANLQFFGLWDAESPIAVRIFSGKQVPNKTWITERLRQAWDTRSPLHESLTQTNAWRWCYGEGDGLPGLAIDSYSNAGLRKHWCVLRTYSTSINRILPWVVEGGQEVASLMGAPLTGIMKRGGGNGRETKLLAGQMPLQEIIVVENGLKFEVDIVRGQKTGFFLDQRDNRRTIQNWSKDKRVLNLFSYTGGFSVYAVQGGAVQVTSIDSAAPVMDTARRNFQHNNFDPSRHEFIVADCFDILEKYHGEGRRFDLIIVDPPSFARSKAQLPAALKAYRHLNTLALKCLTPNGLLASSSCTSQVSPEVFRAMLAEAAAAAKRRLVILHDAGQPLDHPVPAHFPEGRYLKFVLAQTRTLS